jgi:hypothetical protein
MAQLFLISCVRVGQTVVSRQTPGFYRIKPKILQTNVQCRWCGRDKPVAVAKLQRRVLLSTTPRDLQRCVNALNETESMRCDIGCMLTTEVALASTTTLASTYLS